MVLMPAHRPTLDSMPSAPITISARISTSSQPKCIAVMPFTYSSSMIRPVARVLTCTSAPASAAASASARSKSLRSSTYPTSLPETSSDSSTPVPSGANIREPMTSAAIHRSSGSIYFLIRSFATPSAHLTGSPISWRFSIISTSHPRIAAVFAVIEPAGPAPTTMMSYLSLISVPQ